MNSLKIIMLLLIQVALGNINSYAQWNLDLTLQGQNDFDRSGEVVEMSADGNVIAVSALTYDGLAGNNTGEVSIYQKITGVWYSLGSIEGVAADDWAGNAISLSADGMIIAVGSENYSSTNQGHVRVFKRIGGSWVQQGSAIEGVFNYVYCGSSVSLSADGLTLAVGYLGSNSNEGKVSVYHFVGGAWVSIGATMFGISPGDYFGRVIDISADGLTLAIAAHGNDDSYSNAGQVKCFQYAGGSWSQIGSSINGLAINDNFGQAVSISSDGLTLAIGAPNNDIAGNGAGLVRVYKYIGGNWTQRGGNILGETNGDNFGTAVSLNSNGTVLVIGARDHNHYSTDDGQVKVYLYNSNTWTQLNQEINYNFFDSGLGGTVSISDDGTRFVVGIRNATLTGTQRGVTKVYSSCSVTTGTDVQTGCGSYTWIDGITYTSSNSTATDTLVNGVGCDSIVTLNLTILPISTYTDVIIACDSYTWIDGITYNSSNTTAKDTLLNATGCDSVVTLDLTINYSTSATDTIVTCDSLTWINGTTYYASNSTAKDTLMNAVGCDSVVTLNLTINQSSSATDVVITCSSYTWIDGITYTSSNNIAKDTLVNAVGCDSIITLDLTINQPSFTTDVVVECGSYTWIDGITYTSSNNTATDTLVNALGCDSIVALDLTINQSTSATDVVVACGSYIWIDGITYTSSNNTATDTLVNALGCDSIVTLDLTLNQPTSATDVVIACDSYTWIDGITYTSSNNTATDTLVNALGCDSIVTLDLTINTVDVTVTVNEFTITANFQGASYQWLDCNDNYAIIPNQTNVSFTATKSGRYAVEITDNGCADTSICEELINVGINEPNALGSVKVYPNPNQGLVNVDLNNLENVTVKLISVNGQTLFIEKGITDNKYQFEFDGALGVYFVFISTDTEQRQFKLIKH